MFYSKNSIESSKIPSTKKKYQMEKDALAQQEKIILEAQAEAESIRLKGESRAYAIEIRAKVIS